MNNIIFKTILLKGEAGNNIGTIEKTATSGLVDTYTITLTDGTTTNFQVTNGSNIASVEKTATSGLVDTYTITLTNGDIFTFQVTNGAHGSDLNLAKKENSTTASQAYTVGEHLLLNGIYYEVTQAIAQGDTLDNTQGGNIESKFIAEEIEALESDLKSRTVANNKVFTPTYSNGEYGYTVDGVFYPFDSGTTYLGEFSANATIDISELGANVSADDFIFIINEPDSISKAEANYQNYAEGQANFYKANFVIENGVLALTLPILRVYNFGDDREPGDHVDKVLKGKLYYKPSALIGTYSADETINVTQYNAVSVAQFVVAEVENDNTPRTGHTTYQNYGTVTAYYSKATLTLNNNTLTITKPKISASIGGEATIEYKLYFLGKALKFSKQGF